VREWPLDAEREFWADVCAPGRHEHSLWWFVSIALGWKFRCEEPGQLRWFVRRVHQPWLDWVQAKVEEWWKRRDNPRLDPERKQVIICVPRYFGKSNTVTKSLPLWIHLKEPNLTTYLGSEVLAKAKAFLGPMQEIMAGGDPYAWFAWLYGNYYNPDRTWNKEECVTAARVSTGITEPTIGTFGVDTGLTSKHPLLCIYDDPVSAEKLKEGGAWLRTVLQSMDSIYPALRADSLFILIGTRYEDADPIGTSILTEGVKEWMGHPPLDKIKPGKWEVFFLQARDRADVRHYPKGEPVLPEAGATDAALNDYERRNAQDYSSQMMNDPSHGEHMELTKEQIDSLIIPRPKENEPQYPINYATIQIDTAFKDEERRQKGDYSAIVVWLHDLRPIGRVYLDFIWQDNRARSEQFDNKLIEVFAMLRRRNIRVRAITDEVEQGGKRGVYKQHLEQVITGAGFRLPEIYQFNRSGTKKDIRIREAAGYWIDDYVRIFDDCPFIEELKWQMTRIGRSQFDDIADAAADVFRPEIWNGRSSYDRDEQPPPVVQPGDQVLKDQISRQLFPERHGVTFEDLFPEPTGERATYGFGESERSHGPW